MQDSVYAKKFSPLRIKNEERKYSYERIESTGYACYPSTSTQQSYLDNDLRPTRKVQKNKR